MPNVFFKPAVENRCSRFLLSLKFEAGRRSFPLPLPLAFDLLLDLLDFFDLFEDFELLLPLELVDGVRPGGVV